MYKSFLQVQREPKREKCIFANVTHQKTNLKNNHTRKRNIVTNIL